MSSSDHILNYSTVPGSESNSDTMSDTNLELDVDGVHFGFIHLKPHVTTFNFVAYLVCVFFSIMFVVFINQIQTFVLTFVLKKTSDLGNLLGTFTLWDEVVSIIFVCVWGIVSDRIGRRIVFSLGFAILGVSLILYTVPTRALPELLVMRLVFAVGASACTSMLAAGLADIVGRKNGMTSGITGMFSGLGAVGSVFGLMALPTWLDKYTNDQALSIKYTLYIVGSIALTWSITNLFLYNKSNTLDGEETFSSLSLKDKFTRALEDFPRALSFLTSDLRISMGYISGFVARGDTVILTVFVTAWTVQNAIDSGLCSPDGSVDPLDPGAAKKSCQEAYSRSMMLSGIAQVFALIGAPIVGLMLTRVRATIVLVFSSLLGAIGYFGFGLGDSPTSKLMFLWVCLLGFGEIGTIVTSLSFLSAPDKIPSDLRGAVSGVYSFFGAIGIIVCSRIGGYLFDAWRPGAPFILMGIFHCFLLVMGITGYCIERFRSTSVLTA